MKIGIFDSGLGGLIIMRQIVRTLPEYDYVYLGDSARVPYGTRSRETVYEFTRQGVDFLFKKGCKIIIIACNTSSALALRRIQKEFLPKHYPGRKVLGVIVPAIEAVYEKSGSHKRIGVIGTPATVASKVFTKELAKIGVKSSVRELAAPLLVPLIENQAKKYYLPVLKDYLSKFDGGKIDGLILGCTHYPVLKKRIKKILGSNARIFSQEEIVPGKLKKYLLRHPEIKNTLGKSGKREIFLTDLTEIYKKLSKKWFGSAVTAKLAKL